MHQRWCRWVQGAQRSLRATALWGQFALECGFRETEATVLGKAELIKKSERELSPGF